MLPLMISCVDAGHWCDYRLGIIWFLWNVAGDCDKKKLCVYSLCQYYKETWINFVLCSLERWKVAAWNWYCVCFDSIVIAFYYCSLLLQMYFRAIHDIQDRRHISTEHSVSFLIHGNGYPGDSIPVVAVETQQQKQPCCQAERGGWFTVTSNRFSLSQLLSFHITIGLAFVVGIYKVDILCWKHLK